MSYEQDADSNRGEQPAEDYFSRRIVRHVSWTGDLINMDSNEDGDTHIFHEVEPLSPLESDLLTPATLTSPIANTETSPLLQARSSPTTAYASTDLPVVCCRAGPRPANISSNNYGYPAPFQNRPPQSMIHSVHYRRTGHDLEHNKLPSFRRRDRKTRGCCNSKYLHRWVMALSLMAALFLLQYLCLGEDASESSCTLSSCSEALTHSFDNMSTFSFSEDLQIADLSIHGAIRLEPAPEDQESQIVVVASYAASRNWRASPQWDLSDSSIRLQAPTFAKNGKTILPRIFSPRLSIGATIYIRANTTLQTFRIDTAHLSITSSPNLFPQFSDANESNQQGQDHHDANININLTDLKTNSRPINLPHWTSRSTILQTTSSAIAGTFTHLDLISLTSTSGSITAAIFPGEADPSNPLPALLKIKTAGGSVRVTYPSVNVPSSSVSSSPSSSSSSSSDSLPTRAYKTQVQTSSGSISGSYLFNTAADLTSKFGSIMAEVLYAPFEDTSSLASSLASPETPQKGLPDGDELRTSSHSGATDVRVLLVGDGKARTGEKKENDGVRGLSGVHGGASGTVKLRYPAEWEGRIEAESGSGTVKVGGRGVVVDGEERVGGTKRVRAHKGEDVEDGGRIEARAGSGSVDVSVGRISSGWW